MGNTESREARAREAREAEARAKEAQAREVAAQWRAVGLCLVLGSVGAAVLGFKWMLFCLLPVVVVVTAGELWQMAGVLGVVLGSVGAAVLGLQYWVLSWIVPIVGFVTMETWKPGKDQQPKVVLLVVERVVLIVGVAVLGLQWMLALPVAIVVIAAAIVSNSLEMGVMLVVAVGIVGMAVLGLKWGLLWILAIAVVVLPPILVFVLSFLGTRAMLFGRL